MSSSKIENGHQKHARLTKPFLGYYGRNELALMGTPCHNIKKLASGIMEEFGKDLKVSFVDADHKAADLEQQAALAQGAALAFTDKINYRRFDFQGDFNNYHIKSFFNDNDLVLVNGNHFKAAEQILVIDPKKPLEGKMERITDPVLVILTPEANEIPNYLKEITGEVPVIKWGDNDGLKEFIRGWLIKRTPQLKGLVLAGGKSQRMQQDKGALHYHGMTQRRYVHHQFKELGMDSWISCRQDQLGSLEKDLPLLPDSFQGLGPLGALLSAFMEDPNCAWMAVACDLPYLNRSTMQFLMDHRDPSKIATAFQSPVDEFPEPLITIWEPKSYLIMMQFVHQGYSCPRKVLINSDIARIQAPDPKALSNINHPHEYHEVLKELSS